MSGCEGTAHVRVAYVVVVCFFPLNYYSFFSSAPGVVLISGVQTVLKWRLARASVLV